jgi:hypothetical protein
MKYLLIVVSLITFIALIGGCGGDDEEEPTLADYFPLAVGNIWDYVYTIVMEQQGSSQTFTGDIQVEITGVTTLVNGMDVIIREMIVSMMGMVDTTYTYIAASDTAVLFYFSLNDTIPNKYLELPLETGNSWVVSTGQTAVVLGRNNVSVPAGNYSHCWEVAYTWGNDTIYDYFAGYTGIVKEYMFDSGGGAMMTTSVELESATIQ